VALTLCSNEHAFVDNLNAVIPRLARQRAMT
jgi:hypothetical protein